MVSLWHFVKCVEFVSVETVETANDAGGGDGGGENQQVNGETQDQCVSQDAEMEEGNSGNN